jgi:hypothetical protein
MRRSAFALVIALVACGDPPDEAVGASTSSDTGANTSSTGTTSPTTGADATDSTGASTSVDGSDGSSSVGASTTAAPGECDFAAAVDEALVDSPVEPIDCGFVGLDDDVAAWEAARQCARDAALDQTTYKVLWQWQDGATVRDAAIAAIIGEVFATYKFDDDAAVGTTSIIVTTCSGTGTEDPCMVAVGEICLDCLDPSEPTELCD